MREEVFYTLDDAIGYIKSEEFSYKYDKMISNRRKKILKKCIRLFISIILGLSSTILTSFPYSLLFAFLLTTIAYNTPNIIKKVKSKNKGNIISMNEYIKEYEYESIEELIDESKFLDKAEDFQKYEPEAYVDGEVEENDVYIEKILNKEETIRQIFYEIEAYYELYDLPPMKIKNVEWNIFFDGIYNSLKDFSDPSYYYATLYTIVRFTLSKALLFNYRNIKISDFVNNLYYLKEEYNIFTFNFNDFEIDFTKSEILNKISNIVNFEEYKLKRKK